MRIKFISPIGKRSDMLFETFVKTFEDKGHIIVYDVEDADLVFLDWYSGLGEHDEDLMKLVIQKKLPIAVIDATDFGGMSKEIWNHSKWRDLNETNKLIYFMRKMDAKKYYPDWVYPYEVCMYPTHDFPVASRDELFNRKFDICFIGNCSPQRESVCDELSKTFKCDFVLGQPRIEHDEWLNRHRQAKMFLSADGGGFGDERQYQLITIAAFLKQHNTQKQCNPFRDMAECVIVGEYPDWVDIGNIKNALTDKELLYQIYLNGIKHMKKYYSFEFRAGYILNTIENHL